MKAASEIIDVVRIDHHKVFHAGIKVEPVEKKSIAVPLTLPGRVDFNERQYAEISARLGGRIESVRAFTNDNVLAGAILLELFSQEFLSMQSEFLQAVTRLHRSDEASKDEQETARTIYESSRRKLLVVGLMEEDLQRIEDARSPIPNLPVRAPFRGTIIDNSSRQGAYVHVGDNLFSLADCG